MDYTTFSLLLLKCVYNFLADPVYSGTSYDLLDSVIVILELLH